MSITSLLLKRFPLSKGELLTYINTCPFRYKTFPIEKRGGGSPRLISQPSKDLKVVQRYILESYLEDKLKIHDVATAYRSGRSIMDNVRPHLKNPYLLKMDFRDFFPSITGEDFVAYLNDNQILVDDIEREYLTKIFFKNESGNLVLSVGSPGSPLISNAIMYQFDRIIDEYCKSMSISYTRYSDDLTFSTERKGVLFKFPETVNRFIADLPYPNLKIHSEKTVFSSKKFNRHVTGITVSNDGNPSIGHNEKRSIRSRIYNSHQLDSKGMLSLRGYLSFIGQVEPETLRRLWEKYPNQMHRIAHFRDELQQD
ncbi:retron St85 family RNA-directed DNA polymerase [Agrobacterium sp. LMR679]|uniref:retron St85 family RNA-directed DNA polymerase n=1 Tax=Agrobacterium sp. LMR679 TaxID=3014335 RepID=UPI0022AF47CA|nr:retron St85 family RNA-directed DNA polymerase [Agrobacterium sp. LMR679]MCZ4074944.1 retron St85 family RNA-directed DNA polymerase [Agrobacterium sp. LMR679]